MAKRRNFVEPKLIFTKGAVPPPVRRMRVLLGIGAVLVLAGIVTALIGMGLKNGDTIYPNVRVAGVEVGGLTAAEAETLVEQHVMESYQARTLEVRLPDKTAYFVPEQVDVRADAEKSVQRAMEYGRDKGPFWAVLRYLINSKSVHTVSAENVLDMNNDYLRSVIEQLDEETKILPVCTTVTMDAEMTTLTIRVGTTGRKLDTDDLYYAVQQAILQGNFEPIQWDYEKLSYEKVSLSEICRKLEDNAVDAYYDAELHQIIPGINGHTFDVKTASQHGSKLGEGERLDIPLEIKEPEVTTGKLTYEMFGQILEQRSSVYVNNPDRTENLRLACEAINGTILNPGEVFSFNDTVGERTEEKGYRPATIYGEEGESLDGVGGGVCQVASTIYYAALYMDLPTVMREPHMYQVTYVPAGCDATIFWDSGLDYKFRNDRENPIKLQANIDGGKVNITFWGVKENEEYVELSAPKVLETWTDEDVEEVDETKPVGFREQKQTAYTGSKVEVIKKVFDGDGTLLREEKLESTYKSRPNIYIVGPSEEQPPEDTETAEESGAVTELPGETAENPYETTENPEQQPSDTTEEGIQ